MFLTIATLRKPHGITVQCTASIATSIAQQEVLSWTMVIGSSHRADSALDVVKLKTALATEWSQA